MYRDHSPVLNYELTSIEIIRRYSIFYANPRLKTLCFKPLSVARTPLGTLLNPALHKEKSYSHIQSKKIQKMAQTTYPSSLLN